MYFSVLPNGVQPPADAKSAAFLLTDNWDDWFKYNTMYTLFIFDDDGDRHLVGSVKIGQFEMKEGQRRADLPRRFDALDDRFFSIGQDDSYYDDLNKLGEEIRTRVLVGLRDMAHDPDLFSRAREEKVTGVSLLRSVTPTSIEGQFRRIVTGGARLSSYAFTYTTSKPTRSGLGATPLNFVVTPESQPPTNIHVVIGRNGVGKTRLLNNMTRALVETDTDPNRVGFFESDSDDLIDTPLFANLVSVTFSAFDSFDPPVVRQNKLAGTQYAYIGLKRRGTTAGGDPLPPRSPERLSSDFGRSVWICSKGARLNRWRRALQMLEADPIFKDAEVAELADLELNETELKKQARSLFAKLSSGHKIVLLTITRLVETVEERTLILLDEPEAHLHPPLLSAFIRALSDLLINRNGVAIIATHSPVVLQEVPKSCVWKVRRSGPKMDAERPDIETFGENVGILTREVFGLEVSHSGFHKMLRDAAADGGDYEDILDQFDRELGGEAKAILRAILSSPPAGRDH